ncbi:hypothetical protein KFE98_09380 [bacterium SCSIO 12741]|nr:hypothetical protein KFE98_09380 [bacterium SCSIO 12741]
MRSFSATSALIFLLLWGFSTKAQEKWTLQKKSNGVQVYTKDAPGWPLRAYRAVTRFPAQADSVMAFLMEWDNRTDWMKSCKESKLLHQSQQKEFIIYNVYEAPWPVDDRDIVVKFVHSEDTAGNQFLYYTAIPHYIPKKDDYVRIPRSEGFWRITQIDAETVEVFQEGRATTGGSIPTWLADASVEDNPHESFIKMKAYFLKKAKAGQ